MNCKIANINFSPLSQRRLTSSFQNSFYHANSAEYLPYYDIYITLLVKNIHANRQTERSLMLPIFSYISVLFLSPLAHCYSVLAQYYVKTEKK